MCVSLSRQADLCIFSVDLIQKSIVSQILVVGLDTFASNGRWCYKKERLNKKSSKKTSLIFVAFSLKKTAKRAGPKEKTSAKESFRRSVLWFYYQTKWSTSYSENFGDKQRSDFYKQKTISSKIWEGAFPHSVPADWPLSQNFRHF